LPWLTRGRTASSGVGSPFRRLPCLSDRRRHRPDPSTFLASWELITLLPAAAILARRSDDAVRGTVYVYLAVTHLGGVGVWLAILTLAHYGALADPGSLAAQGSGIHVFTGQGTNDRDRDGDLYLFVGRRAPIWNDDGDVAYLRLGDGRFIDSRTVGHPKRHPNGH
jgi:hypothetical protein